MNSRFLGPVSVATVNPYVLSVGFVELHCTMCEGSARDEDMSFKDKGVLSPAIWTTLDTNRYSKNSVRCDIVLRSV